MKLVVLLSNRGKIIFSEMEKFQWWITEIDVEWVQHIDVSSLLGVELSPIWPLMKEFMQAITHFNLEVIESIVKGVSIFITEILMADVQPTKNKYG
jgi:hypothetical protein